jgi:hypothetical protein
MEYRASGIQHRVTFFKKSSFFIEHSGEVWYNYNRHRNGRNLAENRTSRAAAQVKNALFCIIKAKFLNFWCIND